VLQIHDCGNWVCNNKKSCDVLKKIQNTSRPTITQYKDTNNTNNEKLKQVTSEVKKTATC
jgi:hypothetical protein